MGLLKNAFLSYVEMQRSANEHKCAHGAEDSRTIDAYDKANVQKRKVLDMIEVLENE